MRRNQQESIINIPTAELIDFPAVDFEERNKSFLKYVAQMEPGQVSLARREFLGMQNSPGLSAWFVPTPHDNQGREQSQHGVYFGQLSLASHADQAMPTSVAVKPHTARDSRIKAGGPQSLAHEWAANEYIARLSNYELSYLPFGVWKAKNRTPQLLTLFDEQTQTFDNIFWPQDERDVPDIAPQKIVKAMHLSMYALGVLHGAGLANGDAQIKNFARDAKRVRFVDLEGLYSLPQTRYRDVVNSTHSRLAIGKDITWFAKSLVNREEQFDSMFHKVAPLMTNPWVVGEAANHYGAGVIQGEMRNGTALPEEMVVTPDNLLRIFENAANSRDNSYEP